MSYINIPYTWVGLGNKQLYKMSLYAVARGKQNAKSKHFPSQIFQK